MKHQSSNNTMSIMSSSPLESHLPPSWDPSNLYPDIHTVIFGYSGQLLPHESQPQFWSKFQVWDWLQQIMDVHQIDASSFPLQNFDMDGHQLCSLSYQDFLLAAGSVGPILYHSLSALRWNGQNQTDIGALDIKQEADTYSFINPIYPPAETCETSLHPIPPVPSHTPTSPELKRCSRPCQTKRQNPRGIHLWEFIRDILIHPERNPGLIKWEDRTQGVFRFLKSEAVAQLWGKKKNNSNMTYEKLSRAMRYYYKREILERVDGRRLVYKFGRNARGWREVEK
ncbi:ETS homologous factor [Boleophthalmus pectinirostris]|uniref:ETS homologous factor n=1 Tax=Boleophthalmus pectinirostris TaxID=150288 RepID=UPI00242EA53E|nr:ETS homologous factor [Boleophthalmus pectinirostris]